MERCDSFVFPQFAKRLWIKTGKKINPRKDAPAIDGASLYQLGGTAGTAAARQNSDQRKCLIPVRGLSSAGKAKPLHHGATEPRSHGRKQEIDGSASDSRRDPAVRK